MRYLLIVILSLAFIPLVYAGSSCDITSETSACGVSIAESGHGAVELCEDCFVCGAADGVCPEDYSDGTLEDRSERMEVMMHYDYDTRPDVTMDEGYSLMYDTGDEACAVISGDCNNLQISSDYGETWQPYMDVECNTDISILSSTDDRMVKAVCEDVPRTASCAACADPDCQTDLRGLVYDSDTDQPLEEAAVAVMSDGNTVNLGTNTNLDGNYDMNSARGNLKVSCAADGYTPSEGKEVFLIRGKNIVDCPLEQAQCTASCTLPDIEGNPVCRTSCAGVGGCDYETAVSPNNGSINYNAAEVCDGVRKDSFRQVERVNSTHVFGVKCCTNEFTTEYKPVFSLNADDIRNLLTRDFVRTLDDEPVTVRIIVYDRD